MLSQLIVIHCIHHCKNCS